MLLLFLILWEKQGDSAPHGQPLSTTTNSETGGCTVRGSSLMYCSVTARVSAVHPSHLCAAAVRHVRPGVDSVYPGGVVGCIYHPGYTSHGIPAMLHTRVYRLCYTRVYLRVYILPPGYTSGCIISYQGIPEREGIMRRREASFLPESEGIMRRREASFPPEKMGIMRRREASSLLPVLKAGPGPWGAESSPLLITRFTVGLVERCFL